MEAELTALSSLASALTSPSGFSPLNTPLEPLQRREEVLLHTSSIPNPSEVSRSQSPTVRASDLAPSDNQAMPIYILSELLERAINGSVIF